MNNKNDAAKEGLSGNCKEEEFNNKYMTPVMWCFFYLMTSVLLSWQDYIFSWKNSIQQLVVCAPLLNDIKKNYFISERKWNVFSLYQEMAYDFWLGFWGL